ncbi:polysaccharide deacetylase family protein [Pseudoflavitalea rhizosphaerae]|uniref:polysaccharide deacetylase family protein n=1 Tax=Pseudoflavitalea rhizosphaerae TaxID=1884793 RepID=UPI0013E0C231|nr:polysaccharide deacetylase family protein [Pseudoflavitalea rhizosphaerae]
MSAIQPASFPDQISPPGSVCQKDSITLYLTFDDGIVPGSQALLQIADSCQVPINVFLIGCFVLKNDSTKLIWKHMQASPWIEAGNHSYSHANRKYHQYYSRPGDVAKDFKKNQDSLGFTNQLARLPGRNAWRTGTRSRNDLEDGNAIADSLARNGYQVIGWDLEWNYSGTDLSLEPEDDLIFRIRQTIRNHNTFTPQHLVILCHDPALDNPLSVLRLKAFIQKIRNAGPFRFSFLSKYPGLS